MAYNDFKPIVDLVLNNWTALQLAVEHGMGAPGGKQTAQLMAVYVARYCVENIVDHHELVEVLEDLMDEEFETVCNDESPREVASLLLQFLNMLKEGRHDELKVRIDAMPKCQMWLSQPWQQANAPQGHGNPDDDTTSSSDNDDEAQEGPSTTNMNGQVNGTPSNQGSTPMDQDSDDVWTVVRTRRKK